MIAQTFNQLGIELKERRFSSHFENYSGVTGEEKQTAQWNAICGKKKTEHIHRTIN